MDAQDKMFEAADAYRDKFDRSHTTVMLPPDLQAKAAKALTEAVARDEPFKDDAAFFRAIGLEPPGDDDVV